MRLLRQDRDLLDTVQLILTIVTGAVAVRLTVLQGELSRRIQREGITQTYAEKILSHLNDLKMDPEQRSGVVIDVLDIITEANLNAGERPYTDAERQQLIPLRLALATHDADLIAHIGADKRKLKLWTDTVIQSGNDEIKRTAIKALGQIGRYRGSIAELETFRFCFEKIFEISDDFARTALTQDAIEQFSIMVGVTNKVPILLEDEPLKALLHRGRDALVIIASTSIKEDAATQQLQQSRPTPSPSPLESRPTALMDRAARRGPSALQLVALATPDLTLCSDAAGVATGSSHRLLVASSVLQSVHKALQQVDDLNLRKDVVTRTPASTNVDASTIVALKSADVQVRRKARDDLAAGGAGNVPLLIKALRDEPNDYRIKVGVSFTLSKINEPVSITDSADAALLVRLIGDSEPEVRQYASEFLMRLADPGSVKVLYPELQKAIEQAQAVPQPNENAVFNAVVVLGTWTRTLPDSLASTKKTIAEYLNDLGSSLPKDKWVKTVAVIKELNASR
ncbi:MAG: hypothetical protein ACJ8LL_05875 [Candidatus Udaeobacter sp.]